jgi:hypothetical protein
MSTFPAVTNPTVQWARPGSTPVRRPGALAQPEPERAGAGVAVAVGVDPGELVVHVPQDDRGMAAVAPAELFGDGGGRARVLRGAGAEALPAALAEHMTGVVDEPGAGVTAGEPGRRRGGGRAEVDQDPGAVQQVEHAVEPVEGVLPFRRLDQRPVEHPDADRVDPGRAHERDVLGPDLLRPLLRRVVAAEGDRVQTAGIRPPGIRLPALPADQRRDGPPAAEPDRRRKPGGGHRPHRADHPRLDLRVLKPACRSRVRLLADRA